MFAELHSRSAVFKWGPRFSGTRLLNCVLNCGASFMKITVVWCVIMAPGFTFLYWIKHVTQFRTIIYIYNVSLHVSAPCANFRWMLKCFHSSAFGSTHYLPYNPFRELLRLATRLYMAVIAVLQRGSMWQ